MTYEYQYNSKDIKLVEYANNHPFPLEPLVRLGVTEEGSTVKLEEEGLNHYMRQNSISAVN
jgi:hypothetical protein